MNIKLENIIRLLKYHQNSTPFVGMRERELKGRGVHAPSVETRLTRKF